MQVRAANTHVCGLNHDLALAAFWDGYIVFDLDVFFAIVPCGFHLEWSVLLSCVFQEWVSLGVGFFGLEVSVIRSTRARRCEKMGAVNNGRDERSRKVEE